MNEWCEYLCNVISERRIWSNSGFRGKSKTLLTIVCDSIVNERNQIYDRYVYSKHLENITNIYTLLKSIPSPSSKKINTITKW